MRRSERTHIIEVNVDAAVVDEDKIANGVGSLNGIGVMVPRIEKPWIPRCEAAHQRQIHEREAWKERLTP